MKAYKPNPTTPHSHYRKVAAHFSKAAKQYEKAAELQHEVGHRLLSEAQFNTKPKSILDLGCSTGYFAEELQRLFPDAELYLLDISMDMLEQAKDKNHSAILCANMEELPFANHSVDLIFANMSLQWSSNFSENLAEIQRILTPGGTCLFSMPGPLSLIELKRSWQAVDNATHVNHFQSLLSTQQALQHLGFKDIKLYDKCYELEYSSVIAMMQHLKATGADCVLENGLSLTGKTKFKQMIDHYESLRKSNALLPCTYEIIFGQVRR